MFNLDLVQVLNDGLRRWHEILEAVQTDHNWLKKEVRVQSADVV